MLVICRLVHGDVEFLSGSIGAGQGFVLPTLGTVWPLSLGQSCFQLAASLKFAIPDR